MVGAFIVGVWLTGGLVCCYYGAKDMMKDRQEKLDTGDYMCLGFVSMAIMAVWPIGGPLLGLGYGMAKLVRKLS